MIKKFLKPLLYIGSVVLFLSVAISCEEDFTQIGTSIVDNNQFNTNDTAFFVTLVGKDIPRAQSDGLAPRGPLNQYLLGVYNNPKYKKIEASIISQVAVPFNLTQVDREYGNDTVVVSTIDTVLLRLPYQATSLGVDGVGPLFELDSIIGDRTAGYNINVYRIEDFLNVLDPDDPARPNSYFSDDTYAVFPEVLNSVVIDDFKPRFRDTAQFVFRRLNSGTLYEIDTIRYQNSNPSIAIPLKKDVIKEAIFDRYESAELASQDAFNGYFRGLKIQADGPFGSLMSLSLNTQGLEPVMDIYYTNTILEEQLDGSLVVVDTIAKTDSFGLFGIQNSQYNMTPAVQAAEFNQVPVQGTAGSMASVTLMTRDQLNEFRTKDWLINDATLTLYVDKTVVGSDIVATPFQLFIYKDGTDASGNEVPAQILDMFTEPALIDGFLNLNDDSDPDNYTFKITDYISELFSGNLNDLQPMGIKVFNQRDLPTAAQDTIIETYNWNPKAVMLLNHELTNGVRRATLKISYSEKNLED